MNTSISSRIIPRTDHPISRDQISSSALSVLNGLKAANFDSYLVGGCVRDLLLGREPKDFDVVTNARPEEIRRVFRNARLIGRRFKLVHVRFGREIIEVATYRARPQPGDAESHAPLTSEGRILRDNVYGGQEEDALRRDFTVNALYYNFHDFSIVDYVDGVSDLERGLLRVIGDAAERYREDPVRMLRAVRFIGKLGFRLSDDTEAAIGPSAARLDAVPPARLFEEVLKLFHGGYAAQTFELLRHYNLFRYLFPLTDADLARDSFFGAFIARALENTDERIHNQLPVTPAFLFAVMLWHPMQFLSQSFQSKGLAPYEAYQAAAREAIQKQTACIAVPRRFTTPMREIWSLQSRLERRGGKRALRLLHHPRFRAAYDFLCLRAHVGETSSELADWWTRFQEVEEPEQRLMVQQLGGSRQGKRRHPRKTDG